MLQKKKLILFIHGLSGNKRSFGSFFNLIEEDKDLQIFDTAVFEYTTGIFFIPQFPYLIYFSKLPKVQSLANALGTEIALKYSHYDEITLVCHSMGGLIAKKYIVDTFDAIKNHTCKVNKLVFYAVPNIGSDLARLLWHPQIGQLNRDSDFLEFLNRSYKEKNISSYIEILHVVGSQDRVVNRTSASGVWEDNFREIENKGHFINGVAKPKDNKDNTFLLLKNFVLTNKQVQTKDQPYLHLEELTSNKEGIQRFNYNSIYIPFSGREKEFAELDKFVEDDNKFLWWVLHEAGGSGKSRLAYEYAKKLGSSYAGFCDLRSSFDWEYWIPAQETFIILDYAGSLEQLLEIILICTNRASNFKYKVRFLLLERSLEHPKTWYEKLFEGSGNTNRNSCYRNPLPLSTLNDSALFEIAKSFNPNMNMTESNFTNTLINLDSKKRPLFAALLGEASAVSSNIKTLNQTSIITAYLHRTYEKYWKIVSSEYFVLAIIITIFSKLSKTKLVLSNEIYLPENTKFDRDVLENILVDSDNDFYIALQPDIIGEIFVLEYLNPQNRDFNKLGIDDERNTFILEYAWKANPLATTIFIGRCGQDFLQHESIKELLDVTNVGLNGIVLYAQLSVNLIGYYIEEKEMTKAEQQLEVIETIYSQHKDNEEILLAVAKGSVNLIVGYGRNPGNNKKTLREISKIQDLANQHQIVKEFYNTQFRSLF